MNVICIYYSKETGDIFAVGLDCETPDQGRVWRKTQDIILDLEKRALQNLASMAFIASGPVDGFPFRIAGLYPKDGTIHHTQVEELRSQPLDFILKKED